MLNQEIRYRLKASDGSFWSYGTSFNKTGKTFRSIPTMLYEFRRHRKNCQLGLTIEQVTMGVIATESLDLSEAHRDHAIHDHLQDKMGTHVANFYRDNGNSFAPYEYMIDLFCVNGTISDSVDRLKGSGHNPRSYKKKQHVIYTASSELIAFVEMAFTQSKNRQPAVTNLTDLAAELDMVGAKAYKEAQSW